MKRQGKKEQSLLARAVTANMLLVGVSVLLLTWVGVALQRAALEQQLQLRAEALADFLATQSQFGMLVANQEALEQIGRNALSVEDVLFVTLLDRSGKPVVNVVRTGRSPDRIPAPIRRGVAAEPTATVNRFTSAKEEFLDLTRPIRAPASGGLVEWEKQAPSSALLGTVRLGLSMEKQARLLNQSMGYGVSAGAACLFLILGVQYVQLRHLLAPLAGLIEFTRGVGKGDLTRKAPVTRLDEIGHLAVAFNHMVDELGATTVSKNYVDNILQSLAESLVVVDHHGQIRTVNLAALSLLGYREEELVGQPASLIVGPKQALGSAVDCSGAERVYRLKDGGEIPVLFSSATLPGHDGAAGQVWLAQDISARKQAEEELRLAKQQAEQANRAKSEFLSRTSHELRTPLNAILGFAQLLEMTQLSDVDRDNVRYILKGGRHLLRLINEVLDIAGIESGRRTLSPEPVRVGDAVEGAVDLVRPLAANRNIEIHRRIGSDDRRYVMADRQRLQQVLLNLLSNAVKYNRDAGSVVLECEDRPDGWLRICVRDTGLGISSEGIAKLFVPFERLGAEQAGIEGTGLGLTFAKSFTEAMGGSIGVSSAPGQGSTFWIELPGTTAPVERLGQMEEALLAPGLADEAAYTLLYIEDNASNLELIRRVLGRRPAIRLLATTGGEEGLRLARQHHPDLILLDLHLPDVRGDEVLRRLQAHAETAGIPVVMLSADATPNQIQRLLAAGAEAYLTKPIDVYQLLRLLDEKMKKNPNPCLSKLAMNAAS